MQTITAPAWSDYELLATGDGQRLERFGSFTVQRPDPNVIWPRKKHSWKADAIFEAKNAWEYSTQQLADGWHVAWEDLHFKVKPTPFRHVGLFPEQSVNWAWVQEKIKTAKKKVQILNLFAYTGAASVAAAKAGAEVCHVDASRASIYWAKENAALSGLPGDAIRWIEEDVIKFLKREVRRGNHYDLIMLDPPVFGRGPKGEIFRLEERLVELFELCKELLTKEPLGFLLNFYATALYPESVLRLGKDVLGKQLPNLELYSLCLEESVSKNILQTGFFLRS